MQVQLIDTIIERGFIDFKKVNASKHRQGDLYENGYRFMD